jgi:hypothetical protein
MLLVATISDVWGEPDRIPLAQRSVSDLKPVLRQAALLADTVLLIHGDAVKVLRSRAVVGGTVVPVAEIASLISAAAAPALIDSTSEQK